MEKDKKYSKYMGKIKLENYKKININRFSYKEKEKYISIVKYVIIKIIVFLRNCGIPILRKNDFFNQFTNCIHYNYQHKIAVYTSIFGKYDEIVEPEIFPENIDYYIITDLKLPINSKWKKIEPEQLINMKQYSNVEKNRYFKMLPYEIFEDYSYSIYIDGNIKVISDLSEYIDKVNKSIGIAFHKHRTRNCVYEEIDRCMTIGKAKKEDLEEYRKNLLKEGMPEEYGLLEAGVIIREHHNEIGKELMQQWWQEFMKNATKRDQLALPYILWKNNIKPEEIATLGNNFHRNYAFEKVEHLK